MPVQSSYSERITALVLGQILDQENKTLISRTVEDAAGIGFGKVVVQGSGDYGVKVPAGGGEVFRGITVRDQARPAANPDTYAQYEEAALMTKGVVVVTVGAAVSVGEQVYFVPATGVITNVSTSNTAIVGARFDADAGNGALCPVRLG